MRRYIIPLILFVTLVFGVTQVFANGDDPDNAHEDTPVTEQTRDGGGGNFPAVLGVVGVFVVGGLAFKLISDKKKGV